MLADRHVEDSLHWVLQNGMRYHTTCQPSCVSLAAALLTFTDTVVAGD